MIFRKTTVSFPDFLRQTVFPRECTKSFILVSAGVCLLWLFMIGNALGKEPYPAPIRGVLDLGGYSLQERGPLSLEGEWEFFWKTTREELTRDTSRTPFFIHVPAPWSSFRMAEGKIPVYGYATYRLVILRGGNAGRIALKFREVEDSYRIYVNGRKMGEVGFFSKEYRFARWSFRPAVYVIEDVSDRLEITIEASNHVYHGGGLTTAIDLGTETQIRELTERNRNIEFFVFGVLLMFGLYHLGFYFMRHDDRAALFFAIFTLLFSLRTLLLGERFLPGLLPDRYFEFIFAVDFITIIMPVSFFLLYTYQLFPGILKRSVRIASVIPGFVLSLFIVVTPSRIFSRFLPLYNLVITLSCILIMYLVIAAIIRKREDSRIFLVGFILLAIPVINDVLYSLYIIDTAHISSIGLCLFILCQGFILSHRFSSAYKVNTEITHELGNYSTRLASIVEERTAQLKKSNDELVEKNAFLNKLTERLERMAFFDELTRVGNKRYFNYYFDAEWKRAIRGREMLSLILIDIDHFKLYNDTYGHIAGDECLAKVAGNLNETLNRSGDFVSRFGGEEFAALLPGTDIVGALSVAERMRDRVMALSIPHERYKPGVVTISCGVVSGYPGGFSDAEEMLARADTALYAAKRNGRNRVECFGAAPGTA